MDILEHARAEGRPPGMYCFTNYTGWNNQQLTKNCGIVPYLFHKNFGFRAVMVGAYNGDYPALGTYVKGLEMEFIPPENMAPYQYIETHYPAMDVMVMHGALPYFLPLLNFYRSRRPDGRVYLELDPNRDWMNRIPWDTPDYRRFLGQCDVIAASCRRMQLYLSAKWPCPVEYIPNGFYDFANTGRNVDFARKEDIILSVGRIGTAQKRNEILLNAFTDAAEAIPGWRVELIGPVEPSFHNFLRDYFTRFPMLRDRVRLTGAIQDKSALMEHYRRARIFALTSEMEGGTPNVVAEALFSGCYMITSDIDGAADVVADGAAGDVFPLYGVAELAAILRRVCRDPARLRSGGDAALRHGHRYFDFEKIVPRLYWLLFGKEPPRVTDCL